MSLDVLRTGAIENRQHELSHISRAQSASALDLHTVTKIISDNLDISALRTYARFDPNTLSDFRTDQLEFLKANSLYHGQHLDEASLPIPTITFDRSSSTAVHGLEESVNNYGVQSGDNLPNASFDHATQGTDRILEVSLAKVAPPEAEEQAQFDATTQKNVDRQSPKRPARTVHLPPESVQEERLHDSTSDKQHHRHDASSPSSTVGPYSQATPMPPQDSPDTSPDSDTAAVEIPPEYRPSPDEQRAKDEHDRRLAAQKAVAHQAALGDVNTPDDQLKWEEREAAAREAEEQKATLDRNGPEPDYREGSLKETTAEMLVDAREQAAANTTTVKEEHSSVDREAVIIAASTSNADSQSQTSPVRPKSSTNMSNQRSVSDDSPSGRRSSLAQSSSPLMRRQDARLWSPSETDIKHELKTAFADISTLQGAAEDPERDYLEPLFKIQAHDSPNIQTGALPDLIRAASKTISTDDQLTSLHERMEYRILRRIYHLQNANKWSLRQMEKCREPEPPKSHHDHMMAELRWMNRDFREERKRKKSICAWLAARCAEWVNADSQARREMQVQVRVPIVADGDDVPELDASAESPVDPEAMPETPRLYEDNLPSRIIINPGLLETVTDLQRLGALPRALKHIPVWTPDVEQQPANNAASILSLSKFVQGKVLPRLPAPTKKRSRYDYEDDFADIDAASNKRQRQDGDLLPEDPDIAIFNPDNKAIRDRLHAQNAFRPPSEFQMPSIPFYEFRNGSQWISEDDQKLRRLARDYTFNWSIISDQMSLPSRFKSGMERRTPWECFERWVELEQMPVEMRKTVYFKTWYQRLEQSQQNVEKRYQASLAQFQAQAQSTGVTPQHQPMRRRTVPSRVEKRKNTRYLWTVDAMRKNAKKRELAAYKQAEATRAAVQRKASQQNDTSQAAPRQQMLTPQQFSQKRYERDLQLAEAQRAHRQKLIEAQQRQAQMLRQQQGAANGMAMPPGQGGQQRPGVAGATSQQAQGTPQPQLTMAQRQQLAARNGQLAINGALGQTAPQAQMQASGVNSAQQQQNMQRMAAQMQAHARNGQFTAAQQARFAAAMQNANTSSPGGMSTQQQLAQNQALLAAYQAQQNSSQNTGNSQVSASPNMGPPPAPQQLSSGLVPALIKIKNEVRAQRPDLSEEQLQAYATTLLQKSSSLQRQNAMAAAAGLSGGSNANAMNVSGYNQNGQQALQNGNANGNFVGQDGNQTSNNANLINAAAHNPQMYAHLMRQRTQAQMRLQQQQQSPNTTHAVPNGSPNIHHASPNMAPVSPSVQYSNVNMGMASNGRPPSRSATPQMQRLGSSGSVAAVTVPGMQSPGSISVQASPRSMQASLTR